jgi:soluble lytic murein transglycosylase-like protein
LPSLSFGWDIRYDLYFQRWGLFYFVGDDWHWWKAQGIQESGLSPSAVSWCGAQGVMQLMPATAKNLGVPDPCDAEMNIRGGIRYDRDIFNLFHNRNLTFAGYNCGPGNVRKAIKRSNTNNLCAKCHMVLVGWPEVAQELPFITGKNSKETIGYVSRINKIYIGLRT